MGYMLPAILAYAFLLFATKVVNVDTIGLVAAIASFVTLVTSISSVNASAGIRRYLGISFSLGNMGEFKQFVTSSILFVSVGTIIISVLILIPQLQILRLMGIGYEYVWIIVAMIAATTFNFILYEPLVSSLNAKKLLLPSIIGSLIRFPLLFGFVYFLNSPGMGTILSYASMLFVSTAFYAFYVLKIVKGTPLKSTHNIVSNFKQLFNASLASWLPYVMGQIGSQLGVIIIFANKSPTDAGLFYIPMSIYSLSLFIVNGIERITQPLVAGMISAEQRVLYLLHTLKLGFIFTIPISLSLLFFSNDFLGIFGKTFSIGQSILVILMIAVPFDIVTGIVYHFIYGRGDHKSVFYFGLIGSILRTILYFVLIPSFGGNGAALAYIAGSIVTFIFISKFASKHNLVLEYRKYAIFTVIPMALGFILWIFHIEFIIASIAIFFGSLIVYIRLNLFTDGDIHDVIYSGFPKNTAEKIYPVLSSIIHKIK